jgi:hypothetical protein
MVNGHRLTVWVYARTMCGIALFVCFSTVFGASEEAPVTMGSSGALTLMNGSMDPAANPAILGLPAISRAGGILAPILPSMRFGYYSNVLALTPYRDLWDGENDDDFWRRYINTVLNKSFNIEGLSASASSRMIEQKVSDGVSIYEGGSVNLFILRLPRLLVDITTTVDCEEHISGVPFFILFSDRKGLIEGNSLDLSDTRADLIALTRIGARYAFPLPLPSLFDRIESWTKGKIAFDQGALGFGAKYVLGNAMMRLRVPESDITVAPDGGNASYRARVVITESGTGFDEDFDYRFDPGNSYSSGNGVGIDAGYAMSGTKGPVFGVAMHDLGFVAWRDAKESEFYVACDSLKLKLLNDNDEDTTDDDPFIDTITDPIRLKKVGARYTMLPLRFTLSTGYEWDMNSLFGPSIGALSDFARIGLNFEQHLTRWPGRSRIPKLTIGGENGFLYGVLPLRAGFSFGGAEELASTFGIGIDARVIKLDVAYKANGSLYFYPRRGLEIALRLSAAWGNNRESKSDLKKNKGSPAPENKPAEKDTSNFDNDHDNIQGSPDKCPDQPEDKDGFEDEDGCPDFDNDHDSIPDSLDKCPNEPEDRDNFQDADGCPDVDNDRDQIPDSLDKCPDSSEDVDLFEDQDGCPDYDNDNDGIPDGVDACTQDEEIFNWVNDTDGCPDTLALPSQADQDRILKYLTSISTAKSTNKSKTAITGIATVITSFAPAHFALGPVLTSQDREVRTVRLGKAIELKNAILENGVADSMLYICEFDRIPAASTDVLSVKTGGKEPIFCAIFARKEVWAALQKAPAAPGNDE